MNKTIWSYRVAICWFLLFSVNSLCTSITAALVGADWGTLDTQSKWMIVIAITGNWTGVVMGFLTKAAKKIEDGSNPLDITQLPGNTQFITKSSVQPTTQAAPTKPNP